MRQQADRDGKVGKKTMMQQSGTKHPGASEPPAEPLTAERAAAGATEGAAGGLTGWYVIGVAAQRAGVHEQTLRHYERLGLVSPARKGVRPRSPRLYSERDIERVIHIRRLMGDLGVNLAGVETILHMRDRMEALRREMDLALEVLRQEHEAERRRLIAIIETLRR